MKKKIKPISEGTDFLGIYRDDIERIYSLINEISNDVTLEVNDYILDSPANLSEIHDEKLETFEITSKNPYVNLQFGKTGARLIILEPNLDLEMLSIKILDILDERRNKFLAILNKYALVILVISSALIWGPIFSKSLNPNVVRIILTIGLFVLLADLVLHIKSSFKNSSFDTRYKKDAPTFFVRNRDEIIIAIAFLILGLALGHFFK